MQYMCTLTDLAGELYTPCCLIDTSVFVDYTESQGRGAKVRLFAGVPQLPRLRCNAPDGVIVICAGACVQAHMLS